MVTQPAYLKNLKVYSKGYYRDDDEAYVAGLDMVGESDRGAIILSATNIEDMLEFRILQQLPVLREDETARKQIFEADGPISSFSRKLLIAYGMGIVDKPYRKVIDLIREIRNACAHSRQPISLAVPELRAACEVVIGEDVLANLRDQEPVTIRNAYLIRGAFVAHYIATGEKLEGIEAHWAHWRKLQEEVKVPR
ncbi:MAG TPA: hypothetical protein VGX71_05385 [Pseudaminobacter sp.]|nr:hypothetical protein [Pseudaminobacter sp.]